MLTLLLWCCPLCGTNDVLRYRRRRFRPDHVTCSACGSLWEVRRPPEQDFLLRVVAGRDAPLGLELPLAEWYDRMKAGIRLEPLPSGGLSLEADEDIFLESAGSLLYARQGNPILSGSDGPDAPLGPFEHELEPNWGVIGPGILYFTDRRLLWKEDERSYSFWWDEILSAFAYFIDVFGIMYGTTVYRFRLKEDSPLKWVTYTGIHADKSRATRGRDIVTSVY